MPDDPTMRKLAKRFPSSRHFTAARKTDDGRWWVPLDEVEALLPDAEATAWVLDETKETLRDAASDGVRAAFVFWEGHDIRMPDVSVVSTVQDGHEVAAVFEAAARQQRNPSFEARRRLVDLGS
jgi:hypothetical protein